MKWVYKAKKARALRLLRPDTSVSECPSPSFFSKKNALRFASCVLAMTGVSIFVVLFFFAGCGKAQPMLSAEPSSYDFGDISKNGGTVSTIFILKNSGKEPLAINRVSTSCGCTIAEMDQSPIPAGGDRTLTVIYDPMVHPEEFGLIQRAVYIQNSDPNFPELIIDILGNVVEG